MYLFTCRSARSDSPRRRSCRAWRHAATTRSWCAGSWTPRCTAPFRRTSPSRSHLPYLIIIHTKHIYFFCDYTHVHCIVAQNFMSPLKLETARFPHRRLYPASRTAHVLCKLTLNRFVWYSGLTHRLLCFQVPAWLVNRKNTIFTESRARASVE